MEEQFTKNQDSRIKSQESRTKNQDPEPRTQDPSTFHVSQFTIHEFKIKCRAVFYFINYKHTVGTTNVANRC